MILDAAVRRAMHAVENLDDRADTNLQPRFLSDFAYERFRERLADFNGTARQAPLAFQGLVRALDQYHALVIDNDRADADHRLLGILPHK